MKKYSFLPILALVLGIAASAFTIEKKDVNKQPNIDEFYFYLNSADPGDENELNNWVFDDEDAPTVVCNGSQVLCSVKAPAIWTGTHYEIDASALTSPVDMRNDPAVSDQQFKPSR